MSGMPIDRAAATMIAVAAYAKHLGEPDLPLERLAEMTDALQADCVALLGITR